MRLPWFSLMKLIGTKPLGVILIVNFISGGAISEDSSARIVKFKRNLDCGQHKLDVHDLDSNDDT